MRISPYLFFDGHARDAGKFYAQCLGGELLFQQTYDGTPMAEQSPPEMLEQIIHSELQVGPSLLMLSDIKPSEQRAPERMYIGAFFADAESAHQAAAALKESDSPLQQTFWTDAFGMVEDQFGVKWIISTTDTPDLSYLAPFLFLYGDSKAALDFYADCLGGHKTVEVAYGDTPMADKMPAGMHDKIMRAKLQIGDCALWASDVTPEHFPQAMHDMGMQLSVNCDSVEETEQAFNALAEGGKISMPLEKTFWTDAFGMLKDKFGVAWMFNCDQLNK